MVSFVFAGREAPNYHVSVFSIFKDLLAVRLGGPVFRHVQALGNMPHNSKARRKHESVSNLL